MAAEIVFLTSVALIAYACIGYPAVIWLLSRLRPRPVRRADIEPTVSVIIAAHNEQNAIAGKLENTMALDYPEHKLEIIVASDCSTDRTDEIVREFLGRGVSLHRQTARLGKTMVQNSAAEVATGEVLVFTDATTEYRRDALRKLVRPFADSRVGCVSSRLIYVDRSQTSVGRGCRSYWSYEEFLREAESRFGSMIGVTGCLYAVRRSSYSALEPDMCSDFVIASEIHRKGLRTIYEPNAISIEDTNEQSRDEFRMRVRIMHQTMNALSRYRDVLSPARSGMYAFQMLSHKVLRYAISALLLIAFLSNLFIDSQSSVYRFTMAVQGAFYAAALAGFVLARFGHVGGPLAIPYYFALANAAIIVAFVKFVRGEAHAVWEPLRSFDQSAARGDAGRAAPGIGADRVPQE